MDKLRPVVPVIIVLLSDQHADWLKRTPANAWTGCTAPPIISNQAKTVTPANVSIGSRMARILIAVHNLEPAANRQHW